MKESRSKLGDCIRIIAQETLCNNTYEWDDSRLIPEAVYDVKQNLENSGIHVDVVHVNGTTPALLCMFTTDTQFMCEVNKNNIQVNMLKSYDDVKILA